MFTFAERTAPTRTRDTGIISSQSLRFAIAPGGRQCSLQAHDATADSRSTKTVDIVAIAAMRVTVLGLSVVHSLQAALQHAFRMETDDAVAQPANCAVQNGHRSRWADVPVFLSEE